jgi:DNA invertase Pin-like site-specific DNA recombinase
MDSGIEFVAVDNPHANRLTLHILAAVAEHEREAIAARTKAALQAAKARGRRLGRNGSEVLAPLLKAAARARAQDLAPTIERLLAEKKSAQAIARELNERKVPTPKGAKWHAATVLRIVERLAIARGLTAGQGATRTST